MGSNREAVLNQEQQGSSVARSEIIAAIALGLNVLTMAFGAGVYVNTIQQHSRDIADLKEGQKIAAAAASEFREKLARIDENVKFLRDRASEDRKFMEKERDHGGASR